MDDLTTNLRKFTTVLISLSLGFFISFIFTGGSTTETSSQLNHVNTQLQSLEQQIGNITDLLDALLEKNKKDNLTIEFDSSDKKSMQLATLKKILKEIVHEELSRNSQKEIAVNEDTTRVWELISQVQNGSVTSDFFQSKEINALPAKQKEMVVSEIIGRINRGEIDSDRFFNDKR